MIGLTSYWHSCFYDIIFTSRKVKTSMCNQLDTAVGIFVASIAAPALQFL